MFGAANWFNQRQSRRKPQRVNMSQKNLYNEEKKDDVGMVLRVSRLQRRKHNKESMMQRGGKIKTMCQARRT